MSPSHAFKTFAVVSIQKKGLYPFALISAISLPRPFIPFFILCSVLQGPVINIESHLELFFLHV